MPDKPTREDLRQLLLGKCKQIENQDNGRGCITLTCVDVHHLVRHLCRPYKVSQVCQDFQEQGCHDCDDLACGDNFSPAGRLVRECRKILDIFQDSTDTRLIEAMRSLETRLAVATARTRTVRKEADGGH